MHMSRTISVEMAPHSPDVFSDSSVKLFSYEQALEGIMLKSDHAQ